MPTPMEVAPPDSSSFAAVRSGGGSIGSPRARPSASTAANSALLGSCGEAAADDVDAEPASVGAAAAARLKTRRGPLQA